MLGTMGTRMAQTPGGKGQRSGLANKPRRVRQKITLIMQTRGRRPGEKATAKNARAKRIMGRKSLTNNGWVAKKELVDKVVGHLNEHPGGQKHVSELTKKEVRGKIWKHLSDTEENIELIQYAGY